MDEHVRASRDGNVVTKQDYLTVEETWYDQVVVVAASGAIDVVTAPRLTAAISAAMAKSPTDMLVDLSQVDFMASAGLTVLLVAHEHVTPTAQFGVIADGHATSRIITLLGIDQIIGGVYRTLDDALSPVGGARSSAYAPG